jgi:DNA-binding response OmpR family regulator
MPLSPSLQQRILAVDDDPQALSALRHMLELEGYAVIIASSGEEALALIDRFGVPHLALVDYNMPPGMNGFTLARALRAYGDIPIIMLTAVDDAEKIVSSLEEFADDYIVKPYNPLELVARVRRALDRISDFAYTLEQEEIIDEHLTINFSERRAVVAGQPVSLTPIEARILYLLIRNVGRVVTTESLLQRLWPEENAPEDRLHVHIHRLRRKIEPDANEPQYVMSEWGQGYCFMRNDWR